MRLRWLDCLVSLFAIGLIPVAAAAPVRFDVVSQEGKPLTSAVVAVFVEGSAATAAPGTTADLTQKSRRFDPAVLAIQTGTEVSFPNMDTVRHHVYSFSDIKRFEIKLYVGTPGKTVIFDRPGTAVLGCNIHDQMVGHVHVVDTRWFAVTDSQGAAEIDLPAGTHRLQTWHPDMDPQAPVVTGSVQVPAAGARQRIAVPLATSSARPKR